MTTYRVIAINDEQDFCQCCGKTGLKRVVWIEKPDGQVVHYGTVCALDPAKGMGAEKEIRAATNRAESMLRAVATEASQRYRREGGRFALGEDKALKPLDQYLWDSIRAEVIAEKKRAFGNIFPTNGN